ncbi:hypothetical protein P5673_021081 [Acropora cervicornis]|uniref:Uncharacterized protein n=1 Tax=Acropora cervicornis TaxID=6130 RepID=A0AAD9Q940_ACRCE|nr:hypothetical protein P5673_021081 [Acropora cervicornis]
MNLINHYYRETSFTVTAKQGLDLIKTAFDQVKADLQSLTNRMNNAKEHCHDLQTNWAPGSFNYVMFLDRQNVQCPPSHFLVSFRLQRKGDYNNADVRYLYKCCQFML